MGEWRPVPAWWPRPVYVCICNGVTERDIRAAAAAGCRSMTELTMRTGCGSSCGSCMPTAAALVDEVAQRPSLVVLELPLVARAA